MPPKLSPPTPSHQLIRQRLHDRLDEALDSVAWLIAPAGAGKTSLLADWVRCRDESLVWFRVDRGDRDPARFFKALAQALPTAGQRRLPRFEPEHLLDLAGFTQRYLRAWYSAAPDRVLMVLDNLHEASDPAHGGAWFLAAMIVEKPPDATLVVSSRQAPDGQALALSASPDHLRLDYADLRCRDEEALQLARQLGLGTPDAGLLASADGWMAGVSLLMRVGAGDADRCQPEAEGEGRGAARAASGACATSATSATSTSGTSGTSGAGAAGSDGRDCALFEFFATRAFDALSASSQDLLLAHAFSPCIRPESADRLLGVRHSARELESLWRAQFFVERRVGPDGRTDYLCHPLLRGFLQDSVRKRWTPSVRTELWRRQAAEAERLGDHDTAIELWLQAGDREAAARLLLADAPTLLAEGHHDSWLDRLERLGEPAPSQLAELAHWEGNFRRLRSPSRALACQRRAHEVWLAEGNQGGQLLAACAIIHTVFSRLRDWDDALPWIAEAQRLYTALENSPQASGFQHGDTEYRALASGYSITLMFPGHPLLARWYQRACELLQVWPWQEPQQALSSFVMCYAWWHGYIDVLRDVSRKALQSLRSSPARLGSQLTPLLWVATSGSADGLACDAERREALDRVVALCESSGLAAPIQQAWMRVMHGAFTRRDQELGRRARARISGDDTQHPATRGLMLISILIYEQLQENWDEVIARAEHVLAEDPAISNWLFGGHIVRLELAQTLAHVGRHDRAAHWANDILAFSKTNDSPGLVMLATLVLAAGAMAREDWASADDLLRRGFGLARHQGFRGLCAPAGYQAKLAARALAAGIEPGWTRQLIRDQQLPAPDSCLPNWPYRIRIEVLGPFRLYIDDQLQARPGRAQQRVLELIKALASQGGKAINSEALARAIWGDGDDAAAQAALDIALHRARRLLGDNACLLHRDGLLSLNPATVDLDLWHCQRLLERIAVATTEGGDGGEAGGNCGGIGNGVGVGAGAGNGAGNGAGVGNGRDHCSLREACTAKLADLARELLLRYPEPMLAGEKDWGWLLAARQAWQRQLAGRARDLARACLAHGLTGMALDVIERALEDEPQAQDLGRLHEAALAAFASRPATPEAALTMTDSPSSN